MQQGFLLPGKFVAMVQQPFPVTGKVVARVQEGFLLPGKFAATCRKLSGKFDLALIKVHHVMLKIRNSKPFESSSEGLV